MIIISQNEILDFLKENVGERYTSKELYTFINKERKALKLDILGFKSFQKNLTSLSGNSHISSDTAIVRTVKGFEVLKKVYYYSGNGLQIEPIVHIEKIDVEDLYIKNL